MMGPWRISTLCLAAAVGAGLTWGFLQGTVEDRLEKARQLSYERRFDEAASTYRTILSQMDADDGPAASRARREAQLRLGDIRYLDLGDMRGGASVYRELVAEAPNSDEAFDARQKLARIARRSGDLPEAISQWQALAASGREGAERFSYKVAQAYSKLGDYEQARTEARSLAQRAPESGFVPRALFLVATSFQLEGDWEPAIAAFEELERLHPGTELAARARYQIGQCQGSMKNWEAALESLLAALEVHPDPWRVQQDIARVRKHLAEHRKIMGNLRAHAIP